MRKPRDFDAELKTLNDKAKQLREQKLRQLGELVIATRADSLPIDQLAGALLSAAETRESATREGWRRRGAAFFQATHKTRGGARGDVRRHPSSGSGAPPAAGQDRA